MISVPLLLQYECYGSILKHGGSSQGAWYDRDGNMMANWAGASTGQAKCACGAAGNETINLKDT